jgi:signal transduction histidine kinase
MRGTQGGMTGKRIRILHLEDDPRDADLIAHTLKSEGMDFSIQRVDAKAEFIEALHAGAFDLILSDYSLPTFNGPAALELVKGIRPELPFIFVSGKMGEDLAVESLKQGAMDYVLKSFLSRLPPAVDRAMKVAQARKDKALAEQELNKTRDILGVIIENSKDSIWSVDSDLRLMTINSVAAARFKGAIGVDMKVGAKIGEHILPRERPLWMGWFRRAMSGEDFQVEYSVSNPAGDIEAELSINPIRTGGAIIGVAVFSRDMTERNRAQREILAQRNELEKVNARLLENQAQLIQSEKMASLGQLSAGVAHEINNPMAFVTSNLRTLAQYARSINAVAEACRGLQEAARGHADPAVADAAEKMEAAVRDRKFGSLLEDLDGLIAESLDGAQRVNEIVQSLKSIARTDDKALEPTDVNRCLEEALKLAWNEIKYKCAVQKSFGALPAVQGHSGQLKQVFINLLVNAAQAVPEKGTISIRTSADKGKIRVEIEDDGTGIPEENLPKVFTPFFTTKPVGQGTGLGLPISYGIIRNHQGEMEVRSKAGQGTTFTITLPAQDWVPAHGD